jgi:hypothetical protein
MNNIGKSSEFKYLKKITKNLEKKAALAGPFSVLAFGLSACGGTSSTSSSSTTTTPGTTTTTGTKLTVTKSSAGTYSEATSVAGIALKGSASAAFAVSDDTVDNKYDITLDASGAGVLEFDFSNGDANDTIALAAESKVTGFTTLKVVKGTLDVTQLTDLGSITKVEVNSGIKLTFNQLKDSIKEIESTVGDAAVTITVATEAEARELSSLVTSGSVSLKGIDTSVLDVIASPTATETISETLLTSVETAVTSTVTPVTVTTTSPALFDVGDSANTIEFMGAATGDISVTWAGTAGASVATFSRANTNSPTTVDFSGGSKTVDLKSGQTIVDTSADLNNVKITGAGKVTTTASTGAQTLKVQTSAANELKTGDGDDTLEMGNSVLLTAADVIDMGAGTGDTIKVTADGDTTGAIFNQYGSNVEKIVIEANSTATTHAKFTLNNSAAETDAIEIDATGLSNASAKFTLAIAGTAGNVDGAITVKGGADGDVITTGDGADVIDANGGADTIVAGAGNDKITTDLLASKADAVSGGTGTDELVLVGTVADANSESIAIDLRVAETDQIAAVNTTSFTGNQTGIENFDVSGVVITTGAAANAVTFTNLNSTTDGTTTKLVGTTAATKTAILDIADAVDMSGITNTKIDLLHLADGGVTLSIDVANTTDVTEITGGSGTDVLKLGEAAAFDLSAITSYSGLETINMAVTDKVATSITIDQTGSTDFGGALTGATGTAQTLSLSDSTDAAIDITGITNTKIETISLVHDDDDLTIDVGNLTNVTAINGVAAGNAENLVLSGASDFNFVTITLSNLNIKATATDAQTIASAAGAQTIDLVANGAIDTLEFASTTVGDTVTKFSGGIDVIKYDSAASEAAVINDKQIAVIADVSTDLATDASQNIDGGSDVFALDAEGFIVVGTNAAGEDVDIYHYDGTAASSATVTELLAAGDVVLLGTFGLIDDGIIEDDLNVL